MPSCACVPSARAETSSVYGALQCTRSSECQTIRSVLPWCDHPYQSAPSSEPCPEPNTRRSVARM